MEKDETGKDKISNIFESGKSLQTMNDVKKYKTMILRSGFNERNDKFGDGYYNPFKKINEKHQDKNMKNQNHIQIIILKSQFFHLCLQLVYCRDREDFKRFFRIMDDNFLITSLNGRTILVKFDI